MVAEREKYPIIREEEGGNLIMRATFTDTGMVMITEIKVIDNLTPEDFKYFMENWKDVAPKLNPQIASI